MQRRAQPSRWRWVKRIAVGLGGLIVITIAGALIALHTGWGHELLRREVSQQLTNIFAGGGSLGGVDGSPFGTLTLRDLVINGPDGQPAISARTAHVQVGLLGLLSHQVNVEEFAADDIDVALKRDANGQLEIVHLTKPGPKSTAKSPWSIRLAGLQLRRAHVLFDSGWEVVNIDGLAVDGQAELPSGGPIDASINLTGSWRERAAAVLAVNGAVRIDQNTISLQKLAVRAGDVTVSGNQVSLGFREGKPPQLGGNLTINAGAAAVARLVPAVRLPDDVAVTITATPGEPWTQLSVNGRLGHTEVMLTGTADLATKHAKGELSTGTVDLEKLTGGKLVGQASARVSFDAQPGAPGMLPTADAKIRGWTTIAGIPTTTFDSTLHATGNTAHAELALSGNGAHVELAGDVRIDGEHIAIERSSLRAVVTDPERASGGKAPVHGALTVNLAATGSLRPSPALAVTGTIDGKKLAASGVSVGSLHVAIDTKRLPDRPYGKVHVELTEILRGDMRLGALTLDASDRADGKIAASLRSQPVQNPWLIDADVLVTPPGEVVKSATGAPEAGRGVVIDIQRDRIRAGTGTEWSGHSGHIEIGPERIAMRDFESASSSGHLAIAGSFERAGKKAGDLAVTLDAKAVALDDLIRVYRGRLDGKLAVTRKSGQWQGDVDLAATGLAIDVSRPPAPTASPAATATAPAAPSAEVSGPAGPPDTTPVKNQVAGTPAPATAGAAKTSMGTAALAPPPAPLTHSAAKAAPAQPQDAPAKQAISLDAHTHISLHGNKLIVNADAASRGLGGVKLAVDVDTPANIADAKAWQRLANKAVRTAQVSFAAVDLGRVAELAGAPGEYTGRLDGNLGISSSAIGGHIAASNVVVPRLRGVNGVNFTFDLAQTSQTELAPKLTASIAGIGTITADAQLTMPDRLLEPSAWAALGERMLHAGHIRTSKIAVDPGVLDRFGVISELRGQVSLAADIGEAGRTLNASVDIAGLHGKPIAQPLDIHLAASSDDRTTSAQLQLASRGGKLLEAQATLPSSLQELIERLRTDPAGAKAIPLDATMKLDQADAVKLLGVFGRTALVAGKLDGKIDVRGTIGAPVATAHLEATGLKMPPGPRGQNIKTLQQLTLNGSYQNGAAKLTLDGTETGGGSLQLSAQGNPAAPDKATVTVKATKFDLSPVLVFAPGPAGGTSGQLDANLTVTGLDPRTMKLAGELHLADARVPVAPTIGTLRQAKIDAVIAGHDIKLTANGKLGQGTINVDGSIALDGASPTGGKAKLTLRKVSPIGSVEPQISADVNATLGHTNNQWHADLVVDNGFVSIPEDNKGEKLKPPGAPEDMVFANGKRITQRPLTKAAPANPIFLVTIDLRSTRVESTEFRGLVKGKIEMRASGEAIGLFGSISADRGDLDLFAHRYQVERAVVSFDGSFDPLLDVRISHDYPNFTAVAEVRGRVSKPELTLTSNPSTYSQSELLGFLLGGDPSGDPQYSSAEDHATAAGTSFIANQLGGYVRHALPINIDVLRYQAATATSSAAVEVGTWITAALFLAYRQHLEARPDENTGEGEIEYWLSRRVMVDATAGDRSVDGIDLLWRYRY